MRRGSRRRPAERLGELAALRHRGGRRRPRWRRPWRERAEGPSREEPRARSGPPPRGRARGARADGGDDPRLRSLRDARRPHPHRERRPDGPVRLDPRQRLQAARRAGHRDVLRIARGHRRVGAGARAAREPRVRRSGRAHGRRRPGACHPRRPPRHRAPRRRPGVRAHGPAADRHSRGEPLARREAGAVRGADGRARAGRAGRGRLHHECPRRGAFEQ